MKVFSNKRLLKKCLIASLIFGLMILGFYWASGDRLYFEEWQSQIPDAQELITNLHDGSELDFEVEDICDDLYSFYLYVGSVGDASKGNRPSYIEAMKGEEAIKLYDLFNEELSKLIHVEKGVFGADMDISLINSGPTTIIIER